MLVELVFPVVADESVEILDVILPVVEYFGGKEPTQVIFDHVESETTIFGHVIAEFTHAFGNKVEDFRPDRKTLGPMDFAIVDGW
ncbi:hypothetical protein WICANDRAFT_67221 [Wickerhamomyces anomalus NRRL Y-366-8]|uniref:Uncharacterized protein n=1 Tax=Wickerhamomyces anomalus (strain ATCC 58044 / CBS 1984 / NCYC 433 / NRRL Y-366-8) TaxID=683960 RepID=A0A1E3PDL0_WICAA|nr:uncharacterized protein WICANDRAFT_67221 [Wickerhamomyces anomalus NRRL Y-366-8]ODQ63042.1 hypothetical protein WICANDRAFT_67221 [Wickerhamomyces anomalus NRRL Y-366-8]